MKYNVASRRIVSKRLGTPGYLFVPCLLAVTKMVENAKRSTTSRSGQYGVRYVRIPGVKLRWRLEGECIPKASVRLAKRSSPTSDRPPRQRLNASKYTSGNGCTRRRYKSADERRNGRGTYAEQAHTRQQNKFQHRTARQSERKMHRQATCSSRSRHIS